MNFTWIKQTTAQTQGMWALLRALAASVVVFVCVCAAKPAHAWPGIVTHVTDGDTVWVQPLQGGEAHKVRLLGIDAPEICQLWGPQSRAALHAVLLGQVVEVTARTRDSYGRLLAQLSRQGNDVGAWMVGQGYAWSYSYKNNAGPYEALQLYAQTQHLGLFSDGRALQPRWFRKRFGSCHTPGS